MVSEAWKFVEDGDKVYYNIQFSEVPWKFRKALFEAMRDWSNTSTGWHKDSGNQLFVFSKAFRSQNEWEEWASKFPLQISEKRYWGDKVKVVIHGKKGK